MGLVSAIMPAYNAQAYIGYAIESVIRQTHSDIELVVVDDGSQDATVEIATGFARRDNRVKVISQPNAGVAVARNTAIALAQGDLIAPIDADDLWHPTKIEKQFAALQDRPEAGLVYTLLRRVDVNGVATGGSQQRSCPDGWVFARHLASNFIGNGSSPLIRRGPLTEAGCYDPGLRAAGVEGCEDWLLQMRIAARHPFACVQEYLVGYRSSPDNMSSDHLRMERSLAMVLEQLATGCNPRLTRAFRTAAAVVEIRIIRRALSTGRLDIARHHANRLLATRMVAVIRATLLNYFDRWWWTGDGAQTDINRSAPFGCFDPREPVTNAVRLNRFERLFTDLWRIDAELGPQRAYYPEFAIARTAESGPGGKL